MAHASACHGQLAAEGAPGGGEGSRLANSPLCQAAAHAHSGLETADR